MWFLPQKAKTKHHKKPKQNTTKNQNKTPQKTKTTGRKNAYTIPNGVKIFPFISFKDWQQSVHHS